MGYFLAILGLLLPLGGVFDLIWKPEPKEKYANLLTKKFSKVPDKVKVSKLFDMWFGEVLFSKRAFGFTVLLSSLMFLVSALFLRIVFPQTFEDAITDVFSLNNNLICLAICILATFLADFFSYSQTRIFMRVLEATHSKMTSMILLISDFVASLFFFLFFFSIGYIICFGVIISQQPSTDTYSTGYIPEVFSQILEEVNSEYLMPENGLTYGSANFELLTQALSMKNLTDENFENKFKEAHTKGRKFQSRSDPNYFSTNVQIDCLSQQELSKLGDGGRLQVEVSNTAALITIYIEGIEKGNKYANLSPASANLLVLETMENYFEHADENACLKTIYYEESLNLSGLAKEQPLIDVFLTVFNENLIAAFFHINAKFMYLDVTNLNSKVVPSFSQAHLISNLSLNDRANIKAQQTKDELNRFTVTSEQNALIPFTLLMNSTIVASLAFWLFFILRFLLASGLILLNLFRRMAPNIEFKDWLFSSLAAMFVSLSLAIIACFLMLSLILSLASNLLF